MFPKSRNNRDNKKDNKKDGQGKKFQFVLRKKLCRFCVDKEVKIDFKDGKFLQVFVSERGRILPRRFTGNCAKHQRDVTNAIKRARILAIIPFTSAQLPLEI